MNVHLVISGRVQGVGFRYTAQLKAIEYNLVGWVRNNIDGTVELEIEGPLDQVNAYINELGAGFNQFIRVEHIKKQINEGLKGYEKFSIK